MMMKTAPSSWPPLQQIVEEISGLTGCVISTRYSRAHGSKEKDAAPRTAHMMYGAATARVSGANTRARYLFERQFCMSPAKGKVAYPTAINGTRILMVRRYCFVRSTNGETIAEAIKPTTIMIPPAIPAWSSVNP